MKTVKVDHLMKNSRIPSHAPQAYIHNRHTFTHHVYCELIILHLPDRVHAITATTPK